MKTFSIFLVFTFYSIIVYATKMGFECKTFPSLQNKNFILVANIPTLWGFIGVVPGGRELVTFKQTIFPEIIRDYVDRFYTFSEKTVLFFHPNIFVSTNQLCVKKDSIFFQFSKRWKNDEIYYTDEEIRSSILCLLDYGLNNRSEIEIQQTTIKIHDVNTGDTLNIISLVPEKIREIIAHAPSRLRIATFLNNTKKYYYKSVESELRYFVLGSDPNVSCYFQNNHYNFFNKKNNKVFLSTRHNISQFVKVDDNNYLLKDVGGLIFNYNSKQDRLSVLSYPELANRTIRRYAGDPENTFIIEVESFIDESITDREYTIFDTDELPVLTKVSDSKSDRNMARKQMYRPMPKKKEPSKLFLYFFVSVIVIVVSCFIRSNIRK